MHRHRGWELGAGQLESTLLRKQSMERPPRPYDHPIDRPGIQPRRHREQRKQRHTNMVRGLIFSVAAVVRSAVVRTAIKTSTARTGASRPRLPTTASQTPNNRSSDANSELGTRPRWPPIHHKSIADPPEPLRGCPTGMSRGVRRTPRLRREHGLTPMPSFGAAGAGKLSGSNERAAEARFRIRPQVAAAADPEAD